MDKAKQEITIDSMMIVGKYFLTNKDYVNIMRVCKRYHELTLMYHFNPINDYSLFENMETQHFYKPNTKKEGIERHVYWYHVDYEVFNNRKESDEYKRIELKSKKVKGKFINPLPIENGKCNIPEGVITIGNSCFNGC